jgi:hypothetical protein
LFNAEMTRNSRSTACARRVGQAIGRIGLAALELLDPDRRHKAFDLSRHEVLQRPLIETVLGLHFHGA